MELFQIFKYPGIWGWVIILLIVGIVAGLVYYNARRKSNIPHNIVIPTTDIPDIKEQKVEQSTVINKEPQYGVGHLRALVCRNDGTLDFTTIKQPMGDIYMADTTCPASGPTYLVKENTDGSIEAYDPRDVVILIDDSPERAFYATYWVIVKRVFSVMTPWYKNSSVWFAFAAIAAMFIIGLVVIGG